MISSHQKQLANVLGMNDGTMHLFLLLLGTHPLTLSCHPGRLCPLPPFPLLLHRAPFQIHCPIVAQLSSQLRFMRSEAPTEASLVKFSDDLLECVAGAGTATDPAQSSALLRKLVKTGLLKFTVSNCVIVGTSPRTSTTILTPPPPHLHLFRTCAMRQRSSSWRTGCCQPLD